MPPFRIFFWNTDNQKVTDSLVSVIDDYGVDLLILAEFDKKNNNFIERLSGENRLKFKEIGQVGCSRLFIFCNKVRIETYPGSESSYYTSRKILLDNKIKLLMVAVHLPSKMHRNENTQTLESAEFKKEIEKIEEGLEVNETFVVGDFNMNPFEKGMVSASAFHSVSCRKTANQIERVISDRKHKFFYNPMWNMFGDDDGNPGTYFYRKSEQDQYFWHILDQVIIRPSLVKFFNTRNLCILKKIGELSLVDSAGRPKVSDHLPILFEFNF
ncbi:MAG: hypothetical protein Q3M30_18675 [Candidatus Electrothrix sp. Rat3]|nr:hypothetical protein [Candidatus Electrothrix rattekaaiensis]